MKKIETQITGTQKLPITLDIQFLENGKQKPIVIFCHGFKGFKDWGAWNIVAEEFAENDFVFLKFNFSHNGTTAKNLTEFENLEAFAENNYSKELEDLQKVIDYSFSNTFAVKPAEIDLSKIYLIGHSRGGGAVLTTSFEDGRIQKTTTWAAIDSYNRFGTTAQIAKWKQDGAYLFVNGRTGQKMPIKYKFYEDFESNSSRLDLKKTISKIEIPIFVIHAKDDKAVHFEAALNIAKWANGSSIMAIENSNHVFDSSHPYLEKKLPSALAKVVAETIQFFKHYDSFGNVI